MTRSWIESVRQHHGIEHATITLLTRQSPHLRLVARSDPTGFIVYGDVDTQTLRAATEEALLRLNGGESALAVHPNCGTNLVVAGALSGVAAMLAGSGSKRSVGERLPSAIIAAIAALAVAPTLGRWAQEHLTTSAHVQGLRVVSVTRHDRGLVLRHRVVIAG
jgi:hypothetical protein